MANFAFRDAAGKAVPLSQIDDEVRVFVGKPPNTEITCFEYECVVGVGMAVLMSGGFKVTNEALDAHLGRVAERTGQPIDEPTKRLVHKFLVEDYTFEGWR